MSQIRASLNDARNLLRNPGQIRPAPTDPAEIDAQTILVIRGRFRTAGIGGPPIASLTDEQIRERFPGSFPNRAPQPQPQPTPASTPASTPAPAPTPALTPAPASVEPASAPSATPVDSSPAPVASEPVQRDLEGPRFRRFSTPSPTLPAGYQPGSFIDGVV
jgi:hypothetical protein